MSSTNHGCDDAEIDQAWRAVKSIMASFEQSRDTASRKEALIAARQLVWSLRDGEAALFEQFETSLYVQLLKFLTSLGIMEEIPLKGSIAAAELGPAIGMEPAFLVRMMRGLCTYGVFKEVAQDEYAHTRTSSLLLDESSRALQEILLADLTTVFPRLGEYYQGKEVKAPEDPKYNPYTWTHGMEGQDWIAVATRNPENLKLFAKAFSGRWNYTPATGTYPFEQLTGLSEKCEAQGRPFIVDIGGAQGSTMKEIKQAFPDLKGQIFVQDIPKMINSIPEGFLPAELNIHPVVHNFWEPQSIPKAGVYYLRRVLHDWPNPRAAEILGHVVKVMADDSRLLVAEHVIPDRVQMEDTSGYWADVVMGMFAGRERSRQDWEELFDMAGLEIVKIWTKKGTTQGVVEGKKKAT